MLGLVLGLVWHIGDSDVAGNQLRFSRMLEFLAVLVLLVPCTNLLSYISILSGYFGTATPAGASYYRQHKNSK